MAQRADARRNYARILAVAEEEVAAHGYGASLEQIARTAGVGSATVRRHFPTRRALLEAVSQKRIEALRARAVELTGADDSRAALLEWLGDLVAYCVSARGLAAALSYDGVEADKEQENGCAAALGEAAGPLVDRAARDGAITPGTAVADLITLAVGISLATEHHPDAAAQADRLFRLAVAGVSPRPTALPRFGLQAVPGYRLTFAGVGGRQGGPEREPEMCGAGCGCGPVVACTLSGEAMTARLGEFAELFAASLTGWEREPLTLRLKLRASAEERVRALFAAEAECCAFLTFRVESGAELVTASVTAPSEAGAALDGLQELAERRASAREVAERWPR
ncbi:helix-turn-helix domain-containing protein [Actinocorallia sp. A-T 12471]|uniref:helix-turn-helix domain-containing protein n=1 Tax=Actinocorallia sp. A-T 12471 TaxID=3089813 RepID=UPI0029CE5B20|nr:helix-turn-helix domain-containing protein [Actinocorallia sp. A-T 12471]MDX6740695.1 helix-turn-helix domain-containing protein [Actinocorallia sp. A-T 12471]